MVTETAAETYVFPAGIDGFQAGLYAAPETNSGCQEHEQ